jgi:pyruvate,water dikinase
VEDGAINSWAGRFESVLGVRSESLLQALRTVLASASAERAVAYARRVEVDEREIEMAVIIQRQVEADYAGVINTKVATDNGNCVEIEIVLGLGEKLVDGSTTPARFLVAVDGSVSASGPELGLPDDVIAELADLARSIEANFGTPQDVEFAIEGDDIFVVQSRPLTGVEGSSADGGRGADDDLYAEIVSGLKGHVSRRIEGTVVMPESPSAVDRLEPGSILVLRAATPVWDSIVFQAEGLVTDEGGSTSHAIRVANELSIPAVVGARIATSSVEPGEAVVLDTTGDAGRGRVLRPRQSPR